MIQPPSPPYHTTRLAINSVRERLGESGYLVICVYSTTLGLNIGIPGSGELAVFLALCVPLCVIFFTAIRHIRDIFFHQDSSCIGITLMLHRGL